MSSIHFFNPGHEAAILNESPYYTSPANPAKMQQDLSYLPAWYASPEDWIWTSNLLSDDFLNSISGFTALPKTVCRDNILNCRSEISGLLVNPWGISPQILFESQQLSNEWDLHWQLPEWKPIYRDLCSRKKAKEGLDYLAHHLTGISSDCRSQFFNKLEDVEEFIGRQLAPQLIKSPFSSSGRGLLWMSTNKLEASERQILKGMLKKQGCVSIEKALDKRFDFAMEFYITGKENVNFKGYSLFQTDSKGAYEGNVISSQRKMESEILAFIPVDFLDAVKSRLIDFLSQAYSPNYCGCIGVDMLVYKTEDGFHLHPCVEINMRNNMGWLAIQLYDQFCEEGVEGFFQIDYCREEGKSLTHHLERQAAYPLVFSGNRIRTGYLSLCPITANTKFTASVLIK